VVSLYAFWLDWESLRNVASNNPLRAANSPHDKALLWSFKVVLGVCALAFVATRSWLDLVSLAWLGCIALTLREFYYWHMLISTSWVAAPASRPAVRAARMAFVMTTVALLFNDPAAPGWLWMLHEGK